MVIDGQGNFLSLVVARANRHDQSLALRTVDRISIGIPQRIGADKGYDSNALRHALLTRDIHPCITRRKNNNTAVFASELRHSRYSRQRWKVERSFNWLNNNRRVDRFMEKSTSMYQGFCPIAFIKFYLKTLAK
ncbi:MAG: transposase [Patescibacteria group bacterium]